MPHSGAAVGWATVPPTVTIQLHDCPIITATGFPPASRRQLIRTHQTIVGRPLPVERLPRLEPHLVSRRRRVESEVDVLDTEPLRSRPAPPAGCPRVIQQLTQQMRQPIVILFRTRSFSHPIPGSPSRVMENRNPNASCQATAATSEPPDQIRPQISLRRNLFHQTRYCDQQ